MNKELPDDIPESITDAYMNVDYSDTPVCIECHVPLPQIEEPLTDEEGNGPYCKYCLRIVSESLQCNSELLT